MIIIGFLRKPALGMVGCHFKQRDAPLAPHYIYIYICLHINARNVFKYRDQPPKATQALFSSVNRVKLFTYKVMNIIMKIIYENYKVKNYVKEDHRSYRRNFCNWEKKAFCVYNCDDLLSYNCFCIVCITTQTENYDIFLQQQL